MAYHAAQNYNFVLPLRNERFDNIAAHGTSTTSNCNDYHFGEFTKFGSKSLGSVIGDDAVTGELQKVVK